jgi:hypothetical protein
VDNPLDGLSSNCGGAEVKRERGCPARSSLQTFRSCNPRTRHLPALLPYHASVATSIYIESSIISYLTARASRDVIVAARQAITVEWWGKQRHRKRGNYHGSTIPCGILTASKGDSRKQCRGCFAYCNCRHTGRGFLVDMEFQAHQQCRDQIAYRQGGGLGRLRMSGFMFSRRVGRCQR